MERAWWAQVFFCEFIRHYRKLDDAAIVADVKQSMDDLEDKIPGDFSFGAKMVKWANNRMKNNYEIRGIHGRKGGRPRKNPEALVSQPKSLPGTACGDAAAVTNNAGTAPAGQFFEVRQALPGAQPLSASGETFEEARTTNAATTPVPVSAQAVPEQGALLPEASTGRGGHISTPVPVPAHGNAAGGLRNLGSLVGPETGETLGRRLPATTRADARIREDRDESATVRAQTLDGDAATREGAEAAISGFATSPSDFQKRPGKSATTSYDVEKSIHEGGSERGADGRTHSVRLSPGAKNAEISPIGIMGNVRVTPEELGRYRAKYGDPSRLIDALSTYIAKTGRRYKSHFAALVSWARRDIERGIDPETGSKADQLSRIRFAAREAGIDAFSGKRIDFATGEIIEPEAESVPEIPYNPPKFRESE